MNQDILEKFNVRLKYHIANMIKPFPKYYEYLERYVLEGGKQMRPLIFLEAFSIWEKEKDIDNDILDLACSIEIVHDFLLIHDDIMDDDEIRRDKETLHTYFSHDTSKLIGQGKALILGDLLNNISFQIISNLTIITSETKVELIKKLSYILDETSTGQLLEANKEGIFSFEEILKFYELKTALYTILLPLEFANIISLRKQNSQDLANFSKYLGTAHQLHDDLIEITGEKKRKAESNRCGDLMRLKITPFLIRAFEKLPEEKLKYFKSKCLNDEIISEEEERYLLEIIRNNNIVEEMKDLINENLNKAKEQLGKINLEESILMRTTIEAQNKYRN